MCCFALHMYAAMSACLCADAALNAECLFLDFWRERGSLYTIQHGLKNPGKPHLLLRFTQIFSRE